MSSNDGSCVGRVKDGSFHTVTLSYSIPRALIFRLTDAMTPLLLHYSSIALLHMAARQQRGVSCLLAAHSKSQFPSWRDKCVARLLSRGSPSLLASEC